MNRPHLIANGQRALSLVLSATLTLGLLLSLGAQADAQHAELLAHAALAAQLCAAPPLGSRS